MKDKLKDKTYMLSCFGLPLFDNVLERVYMHFYHRKHKDIVPGHFWAFDGEIEDIRGKFLQSGRHPKCVLKSENSIKILIYTFAKTEKYKGQCFVHSVPKDYLEIVQWLENLNLNIPYRGQGLPGISYQVLINLIKKKDRLYLTGEEKKQAFRRVQLQVCGVRGDW